MVKFPLRPALDAIHDEAIAYSSAVQCQIAERGGCKTLSSEALNALHWSAIVIHRSVRTLCEEGWTSVTSLLNRSLVDIIGNCIAVCCTPLSVASPDYMGFKYMSHFWLKWLAQPEIAPAEIARATGSLDVLQSKLSSTDQEKAAELRARPKPTTFWFQPEHKSIKDVLNLSQAPTYDFFRTFSGPTHGGFELKVFFNDDMTSEDINPREHPRNVPLAILACSRFLAEVSYVRDDWDNRNANEDKYNAFISNLIKLPVG